MTQRAAADSVGHTWLTTDPVRAADALRRGHLVAVPTETVYGLAGLVGTPGAVERIFTVKDRPTGHPLIVHIADSEALTAWASDIPDFAHALAARCWPGPLTLVLPRSARVPDAVTGGRPSVALRVSAHPMMHAILRALDVADPDGAPHGLAAPSANRHGRVSPTTAQHVIDDIAPYLLTGDLVLDGGTCAIGLESTIVDCTGVAPALLRPGDVGAADVERITGLRVTAGPDVRQVDEAWPGGLPSHYAPRARVMLCTAAEVAVTASEAGSAAIASGASGSSGASGAVRAGLLAPADVPTPTGVMRLAAPDDEAAYAATLYAALREADRQSLDLVLAVAPTSASALATAVHDRLQRAAGTP